MTAAWRATVVDNNSTDGTADIVAFHTRQGGVPGLVRIVEPRQGLTHARQRGVAQSSADWVAFVDDDCLLAPEWITEAVCFAAGQPNAGAFGGRVVPDWGRTPPDHLPRHAWLFAAQDHGREIREVESLVGAGVVLNRRALDAVGWTAEPYLADRIGLGHASGGDVEICYRLTAAGRKLWFVPSMRIDHRIAASRQRMPELLGLARGLGAGAELVDLMGSSEPSSWLSRVERTLRSDIRRHLASTYHVVTGRYHWRDWLIRAAFLAGQHTQHRALRRDAGTRTRLGGVWAR